MARSGFIRLRGIPDFFTANDGSVSPPYQIVEITEGGHLDPSVWKAKVAPKREEIFSAARYSLKLMHDFLGGISCPSKLIAELYKGPNRRVAAACSGCGVCRLDEHSRLPNGTVVEQPIPWPVEGQILRALDDLWQSPRRLLVEYPSAISENRSFSDFKEVIHRLDLYGLRLIILIGAVPGALLVQPDIQCMDCLP